LSSYLVMLLPEYQYYRHHLLLLHQYDSLLAINVTMYK
jgi:hypothetical protein